MVRPLATWAAVGLLAVATGAAAEVQVSVDRDPVRLDESFTLTFEVGDYRSIDPDLSALERDFEILGTNQVNSVQIVNGVATSMLSLQLNVMARRAGILTVPPIRFGSELSPPLNIRVLAAADSTAPGNQDIFLEAQVAPEDGGYVQGQLLYTLRLFRSVQTANASLTDPDVRGGDAVVRKLDKDASYETWRDGKRFEVFERRYAVFPQQSGTLTFGSVVFRGEVRDRGWRLRARRAVSPSIDVEVRPRPQGAADPWLPATELQLTERWPDDPPVLRAGEPVTRTLTLVADGLTAAQLPPLETPLPDGFRSYPDQPTLNDEEGPSGIVGFRQEKVALLPVRAGHYVLPEIRIDWFDTTRGRPATAVVPARQVEVLPAAGSSAASSEPTGAPVVAVPLVNAANHPQPVPERAGPNFWRGVSVALGGLWVVTVAFLALRGRRRRSAVLAENRTAVEPPVDLDAALTANDAKAVQRALLQWARRQWPADPPANLIELAARCPAGHEAAVRSLSTAIYAPAGGDWDSAAIRRAVRAFAAGERATPRKAVERTADGLVEL